MRSISRPYFSFFCKCSSNIVETDFWESETKPFKLFEFTTKKITISLIIICKNKAEASMKYHFYLKVLFKITAII